jgi:protein-disulfide isomerase
MRGDPQAARAITVAFVDYASPESAQHAQEVLPRLMDEYVDSGKMVYILHPWAGEQGSPSTQAAIAAECAGQQGQFWEMNDKLFDEQGAWVSSDEPAALFTEYAKSLDLGPEEFETCLESDWAKLRVEQGNVVGAIYGVPGAPVFLFNNGEGQQGSPSFEEFKSIIDSILNS